jgi:23S rRNA pseudouridine1911/1915/1917 synthase
VAGQEKRRVAFTVGPESAGLRLDAYLASRLRGLSRAKIRGIIAESLVGPADRRLRPSSLVTQGLRFSILREAVAESPLPVIPIVYADDTVVVLDKPAGVPVHPAGRYVTHTITGFLAGQFSDRPDPAHRLDRETSGLLVCGRGTAATKRLKAAFAHGEVIKRYVALVEGWPPQRRFIVDLPLQLGRGPVRLRMQTGSGKPARTELAVLRRYESASGERFALVGARPRTGRQHQIRAHLGAVGFPIVGDKLYGPDECVFLRFIEGRLTDQDRTALRMDRHALHARRLVLRHPADDLLRSWRAPLPVDFMDFMSRLTEHRFPR